jgi:hypothetical protein
MEKKISSILNCDPSTIEGVSAKVMRDYQTKWHNYNQIVKEIFDSLSDANVQQDKKMAMVFTCSCSRSCQF